MSEKIPKGWKWVKLKDVIKIKHGYAFPGENITNQDTGKVLVTPGNFNIGGGFKSNKLKFYSKDYPKEYEFQGGEIIVVMTDLSKDADILGYSAKVPTDKKYKYLHNQRIGLVEIISSHVDKDFIYWLMRTTDYHSFIVGGASGTSVMHTSPDRINEYSFPLPPLPEQKAIAEVLSSLDDKIELLHRQNKTLEEMAMTLFRQWFIEPTKDGLPEGWEEVKLKDIYFLEKGIEPGSKNYLETPSIDAIRFIRVGDMLDSKANVYIQKDLVGNSICKFDDILVSFDGTVGRVSFGIEGCYSSGIRKIYSKDEIYNKLWLKHQIFISEEIQDEINMHAEGTTILHASSSIEYLSFPFPPKEKIEEYDKFFDPIYKKMLHNKKSIQTLEKQRDTLLPKLMSGEVRIMNGE